MRQDANSRTSSGQMIAHYYRVTRLLGSGGMGEVFLKAQSKGPLTDKEYIEALALNHRLTREEGIDAVINEHKLDAIVAPTTSPAHRTDFVYGDRDTGGCTTPAAVAGYPHITVPAGDVSGLPVGLSFFGRAFSEPTLLKLAFAFEQAGQARKPPRFLPTLPEDGVPGRA